MGDTSFGGHCLKKVADRRGSMLMEFVLTMPVLFMLAMIILQFAQIWVVRNMVAYAAFCSARSMLSCNPAEWAAKNSKENGAYQAARRVLAWVTIMGTSETRNLRDYDEGHLSFGAGHFSDIKDKSTPSFITAVYGSSQTKDVLVPGWGQISQSNSIDIRLDVTPSVVQGKYACAEVKFKFPLLTPVAAEIIAQGDLDGAPYIELKETCVLPLPYSTAKLPLNAYDYTSYD